MAITVAMRTEVSQLYVALFGRAPDADGLGFWTQRVDAGESMTQIANEMYGTDPARAYYPLFLTNQEVIASFYLNVLGRPADAEGLAYWTAQLNATGATPGSVIATMINVVANYVALGGTDPAGLTSAALFNNKVAVAQYYGEHSGNIADATVVLAGVTADASTVTAVEAQIDTGAIGQSGITAALTTGADLVNGTTAGDTVTGVFGTAANATYNAGDVIDLGAGSTDTLNLVANGALTSDSVIVKNVEVINITDTQGATFDDTLVQNNPGINFLSTQAGKTSVVTNAALGSVYGLAGGGNLTVTYTGASGTADNAMLSLAGVGASTAKSTVNVSSTNTVEKVSIATTGTNYVTLVGGTAAATVAVTGNGTNTIDLSSVGAMAAVGTIDASASTGTNTFALGTNFNTGTTIKGGTGADTVSATLASATLSAPTFTGVETFSTKWTGYGVLDLGSATGLTAVSVNDAGAGGTVTIQNAQSTVSSLTVSAVTTANDALKFGYASGQTGDLAFKIGSTSSSATAVDLGAVTLSGTHSVAVSTLGALAHDADGITISGSQTSLTFNVAAGGGLTTGGTLDKGNLGALGITVGAGSSYSGYVHVSAGKTIGDVTIAATGSHNVVTTNISAPTGNIGNVTLTATGNNFSGYLGLNASGGTPTLGTPDHGHIGNINLALTGNDNHLEFHVSAGYFSGGTDGTFTLSSIGDITVAIAGDNNTFSGSSNQFDADGGNVGNVSITVTGDDNRVHVSGHADHAETYDTVAGQSGYYDQGGGNIGNISVSVDGASSAGVYITSSGGHIGDVTLTSMNGGMAWADVRVESADYYHNQDPMAGNIGNVTVTIGDGSHASGYIANSGGDIGNVSVTVDGANASGGMEVHANFKSGGGVYLQSSLTSNDYAAGGNVGDVNLNINGSSSSFDLYVSAGGGNVGTVTASVAGTGASGYLFVGSQIAGSGSPGGNVGVSNITIGANASFHYGFNVDATMDAITVTGANHATFELSGGGGATPGLMHIDGASIDSVSLNFGTNADSYVVVSGFSGSVGAITGSFGDNSSDQYVFSHIDQNVGAITITEGASSSTQIHYGAGTDQGVLGTIGAVNYTGGAGSTVYIAVSGGSTSMGKVTLTGGDSSASAGVYVSDTGYTIGSMGGVDASSWAGELGVDLSEVGAGSVTPIGTTIHVGAGGSWVLGTEGADNIFEGAGKDTVVFDQTVDVNTKTDVVFNFTAGAGKDVMDIEAANTTLLTTYTADTAHTAAAGDIIRLADITGGSDITTVTGLVTAMNTGGEYASVVSAAAHYTVVTAASATAGTVYVFDVNDADGTLTAADVTLVGVVNLNQTGGAENITTLAATNFA